MNSFIIYALPRSRTAWLSYFLSFGKWKCSHDVVIDLHSLAELKEFFATPYVGTVETGAVDGWKTLKRIAPETKVAVIRRPLEEVRSSLAKFGIYRDDDLKRRNEKLDEISKENGVLSINYADLTQKETCKELFEHCLQESFSPQWWRMLEKANIQIDMKTRLEKLIKNREGIESLKREAL